MTFQDNLGGTNKNPQACARADQFMHMATGGRPPANHVGSGYRLANHEPHCRPMVGGMLSSTVLTLAVIPAIYGLVKQWRLKRGMEA